MRRLTSFAFIFAASAIIASAQTAATSFEPQKLATGPASATVRATDYEQALAAAAAGGKDIVVLQYGSDWNPCSTSIFQNVWSTPAFLQALGPGFVLLAIDYPEVVGGRAIYGRCTAERCGLIGFSDTPIGNATPLHLENLAKQNAPSSITAVASAAGVQYAKESNGTWVVTAESAHPATDTVTLSLKAESAGQVLRLDFPTSKTLPNGGPGRAGNAVISEVEVRSAAAPIKTTHAWGSFPTNQNFGAWTAIDGITDKPSDGWNLNGGQNQNRTLLIALAEPVAAGTDLTVALQCKSQWGEHIPATFRASIVGDKQTLDALRSVATAQLLADKNRNFTWAGWGKNPRLAFLDAKGRPVAATTALRIGVTPTQLATAIKSYRAIREKRDALWAKAQTATGPAKAELLRESLDALNVGRDPEFGRNNGWGNGNGPFEFIHAAMKAADPNDESGAIRWLNFSMGAWGNVGWAPDNQWWKKLEGKPSPTDADYAEAEACIDRELKDPRNRILEHDHIQHIMKARYDLYLRKLKGDHIAPKLLEIQQQIAGVDPNTFWGVGAVGYLGMYRRTTSPYLHYGWDGKYQLKAGANTWIINDAWMEIDHPGRYQLNMVYQQGANAFKVKRVAVIVGNREVATAKPSAGQDEVGPNSRSIQIPFTIATFTPGQKHLLKIECEAGPATESVGAMSVEPLLIED